MASIVAGIGSSHSIMLMARLEDWPHFADVDKERAKYYFDKAAIGGLSPFWLDEEFDCNQIAAMQHKDQKAITSVPPANLKSGSEEIRTWIALAGTMEFLNLEWSDYVPCYRSPAGTGTGIAFAIWE